MTFRPVANQEIIIKGQTYYFSQHPANTDTTIRLDGNKSTVYQLEDSESNNYALKIYRLAYRTPYMDEFSKKVERFSALPGLAVCQRIVITPISHPELAVQYPELRYACLMPWINGKSWKQIKSSRRAFTIEQSWKAACQLAEVLAGMEGEGIAHCNLNDENVFLLTHPGGFTFEFTGVEQLYCAQLKRPDPVDIPPAGYGHPQNDGELWKPVADRFRGGLLIAELLTWNAAINSDDEDRSDIAAPGAEQAEKHGFAEKSGALQTNWGDNVARLYRRLRLSANEEECPPIMEWSNELKNIARPDLVDWWDSNERNGDRRSGALPEYTNASADIVSAPNQGAASRISDLTMDGGQAAVPAPREAKNVLIAGSQKKNEQEGMGVLFVFIILIGMILIGAAVVSHNNAVMTARVQKNATATAQAQKNATATARVISAEIKKIEDGKTLVLGPENFVLAHDEDDWIEIYTTDIHLSNFVLQVRVQNPYDGEKDSWDFGVMFRDTGFNDQYRLFIQSDGIWQLWNYQGSESGLIDGGELKSLKDGDGLSNTLKLVAVGDTGYFYINENYVDTLDLSAREFEGAIRVGTGFKNRNETEGAETKFTNLSIWSISPASIAQAAETCTRIGQFRVSAVDGMTLQCVPAGEFIMGSDPAVDDGADDDEQPQRTVYLDAFWIDQTEVTNAMYARCEAAGACTRPGDGSSSTRASYYGNLEYAGYPVIYVDWFQAQAYCAWAGRRLPVEAEWEKAARGTDGRIFPWGNHPPAGGLVNFVDRNTRFDWSDPSIDDGYADTSPVGAYPDGASPYGALDMAGNVWEWTADWYDADYYRAASQTNPPGPPTGTLRVVRGGSWIYVSFDFRTADRGRSDPVDRGINVGFRCAR